jgi:hypothetical protein
VLHACSVVTVEGISQRLRLRDAVAPQRALAHGSGLKPRPGCTAAKPCKARSAAEQQIEAEQQREPLDVQQRAPRGEGAAVLDAGLMDGHAHSEAFLRLFPSTAPAAVGSQNAPAVANAVLAYASEAQREQRFLELSGYAVHGRCEWYSADSCDH